MEMAPFPVECRQVGKYSGTVARAEGARCNKDCSDVVRFGLQMGWILLNRI